MDRESAAADMFSCSLRERCVFEAGIKLATIYHQYVGTPFNAASVKSLEEAISRSIEVQPYVESAVVRIDRSRIPELKDEYSYVSLTGDMIDSIVKVKMDNIIVTGEMRFDEKLQYPLMFVSSIEEI